MEKQHTVPTDPAIPGLPGKSTTVRFLRSVLLAGGLAAAAILFCFANVLIGPYFFPSTELNPAPGLVLIMAIGAAVLAGFFAVISPQRQGALLRVLAVTAFVYLSFRPLDLPAIYGLSKLPLTKTAKYWAYRGPGGAVLGTLPAALAVLLGGRYLFGLSLREQWNGRLAFALRDLAIGGGTAVVLSVLVLAGAAATGNGRVSWEPDWAQNGANLFSNLYEEILVRGMLLQVVRRAAGQRFAIFWTGLVFGTMHSFGWAVLSMAIGGWILAWVVVRSRSLWGGYVMHQVVDVLVDSCLH